MKGKKDLGTFLSKKKSWKKILTYLEKYLNKYGVWEYTYEFDAGTVKVIIKPLVCDKPIKVDKPYAKGLQGVEQPMTRRELRRMRRLSRKGR